METVISLHSGLVGEPGGRFIYQELWETVKKRYETERLFIEPLRGEHGRRAPLLGNVQATSDMSSKAWEESITLLI